MQWLSPIISAISLCVSLFTAWYTIFRRGTVKSTQPSMLAFRYDFVGKELPQAKIFLRIMLFSTSKRGWIIERMFLRVREGSRKQEFSFWGYGDKELVLGSGLFVPENGVVTYHHFNPINTDTLFNFSSGKYEIELVAQLLGRKKLILLWSTELDVTTSVFNTTVDPATAIFYNWSPDRNKYLESTEVRPEIGFSAQMMKKSQI
jgi:hypothetical protein